jgi:hypothetical protein
MQAATLRAIPAAVQAVTHPLSAPEASAMTFPAAAWISSRIKNRGSAAVAVATISGRTAAPDKLVIFPQALITGVRWYLLYRSIIGS